MSRLRTGVTFHGFQNDVCDFIGTAFCKNEFLIVPTVVGNHIAVSVRRNVMCSGLEQTYVPPCIAEQEGHRIMPVPRTRLANEIEEIPNCFWLRLIISGPATSTAPMTIDTMQLASPSPCFPTFSGQSGPEKQNYADELRNSQ